ncbi:hypothetical protein QVN42_03735 [Yersinia nurmii]|uniref:Uncharacterized protein n=1 Tax=Yersinia nurmii TaxID=685706 RepID=A0AAW7JU66_9GAMM|nr:hypothetical protein [Yersinia nurmii]MDN0086513.1 hypothetical protein [Yersinia nurmii]
MTPLPAIDKQYHLRLYQPISISTGLMSLVSPLSLSKTTFSIAGKRGALRECGIQHFSVPSVP